MENGGGKAPKRGSRRWSLLSLTPLRSSAKHAPISPVEETLQDPGAVGGGVCDEARAAPVAVVADSESEGEEDEALLDQFVRGLRTSTTCWDSPRAAAPRGRVVGLAPESKRILANVVAVVWQRRRLGELYASGCGGALAARETVVAPDLDLPSLKFSPPRQQCGDGCLVSCVEELLETACGVSKRFEQVCVAALHTVHLDPSRAPRPWVHFV